MFVNKSYSVEKISLDEDVVDSENPEFGYSILRYGYFPQRLGLDFCIRNNPKMKNSDQMKQQKIALVTGGSRGLGRDMAINLAKKGLDVVITYHSNEDAASEVVSQIEKMGRLGYALQLDTSKPAGFAGFYEKLSDLLQKNYQDAHFDYLINNAGTGLYGTVAATTEEQFDEMLNIHFNCKV